MADNVAYGNVAAANCGQDTVKIPSADMTANISKAALMKQMNEVSFAMDDAKLFLDTHPGDMKALAYFENMAGLRNSALAAYESQYGPLFAEHVTSGKAWTWETEFWPWEGGC